MNWMWSGTDLLQMTEFALTMIFLNHLWCKPSAGDWVYCEDDVCKSSVIWTFCRWLGLLWGWCLKIIFDANLLQMTGFTVRMMFEDHLWCKPSADDWVYCEDDVCKSSVTQTLCRWLCFICDTDLHMSRFAVTMTFHRSGSGEELYGLQRPLSC